MLLASVAPVCLLTFKSQTKGGSSTASAPGFDMGGMMGFPGNGMMDPAMMSQMMQNPVVQEMMQNMFSNPELMQQV
jgi:hypothetical protein